MGITDQIQLLSTALPKAQNAKKILIVLFILIAIGFIIIYIQNSRTPELGVVDGKLKPLGSRPNCVSTQTSDTSKLVPTLVAKGNAAQTREAILGAIEQYGGAEIVEQREDYVYAIFVTPTMKYRDDVEFWIDADNSVVHFRSSSRAGYSDRGLNRQRYNALAESYNSL